LKPVLFIAYFFPPENDTGTFRSLNFAKRLPALGYKPVVLTTDAESILLNGSRLDDKLLAQLPEEISIHRFPDKRPLRNKLIKQKLIRFAWIFRFRKFVDAHAEWSRSIVKPGAEIVKKENIDTIYISCAPLSAAIAGIAIKKKTGAKVVVDFRDPYVDAYGNVFPSYLNWQWAKRIERTVMEGADVVIVNTDEVLKTYQKRYPNLKSKFTTITNGY